MAHHLSQDETTSSLDEQFHSLKKCLDYICTIRQPGTVVTDKICHEATTEIKRLLDDEKLFSDQTDEKWSFLSAKNYELIFVDILYCLARRANKFDLDASSDSDQGRQVANLDLSLAILYKLTESQLKNAHLFDFSVRCVEEKVIEALLSLFECDLYLNKISANYDPHARILDILGVIRNLSENPLLPKEVWSRFRVEETLAQFWHKSTCPNKYKKLHDEILRNLRHKTLVQFIEFLLELNEPAKITRDETVYNDLFFIKYQVKSPSFDEQSLFLTMDCVDLFARLLSYLHDSLNTVEFDYLSTETHKPHSLPIDVTQREYSILYNVLVIINEIVYRSEEARAYFGQMRVVKCLAAFLTPNYVKKLVYSHKKLILLLIKTLSMMSRWSHDAVHEWSQLSLVDNLSSLINKFESEDKDKTSHDRLRYCK